MKTAETIDLERRVFNYAMANGQFGCHEVTLGFGGMERVDFLSLDSKRIWRCYEIKISKADFHSKAANSFKGHLNYYVMPHALYLKVQAEIPQEIGVLVPDERDEWHRQHGNLYSAKGAKRVPLKKEELVLYDSLLRSMHRAYQDFMQQKDSEKFAFLKKEKEKAMQNYEEAKKNFNIAKMKDNAEIRVLRQKLFILGYDRAAVDDMLAQELGCLYG